MNKINELEKEILNHQKLYGNNYDDIEEKIYEYMDAVCQKLGKKDWQYLSEEEMINNPLLRTLSDYLGQHDTK